MTGKVYDQRLVFMVKMANNLERLSKDALAEAYAQFPADVVRDVQRTLAIRRRLRGEPKQ